MLPSERTARLFWSAGMPAALPDMLRDLAERAALIAVGLMLSGTRRRVGDQAIAGALVVELAVLHYFRPKAGR